jgi:hypothetical protein
MTVVRRFFPDVRLKRLIAAGGGMRTCDALERAEHELGAIREDCLAGVDAKIERVFELAHEGEEAALEQCYMTSNEIFAEAGAFGLGELSAAAHSLCALLSAPERGRIPLAAISVHIDAMRALRTPQVERNDALRRAVLAELEVLARRFSLANAL